MEKQENNISELQFLAWECIKWIADVKYAKFFSDFASKSKGSRGTYLLTLKGLRDTMETFKNSDITLQKETIGYLNTALIHPLIKKIYDEAPINVKEVAMHMFNAELGESEFSSIGYQVIHYPVTFAIVIMHFLPWKFTYESISAKDMADVVNHLLIMMFLKILEIDSFSKEFKNVDLLIKIFNYADSIKDVPFKDLFSHSSDGGIKFQIYDYYTMINSMMTILIDVAFSHVALFLSKISRRLMSDPVTKDQIRFLKEISLMLSDMKPEIDNESEEE